jgi:hypothetical protein
MAGQDLDLTFLCKANWPLIPGQCTEQNKAIHKWCGQMSQVIEALYGRIQELEKTQTAQSDELKKRVHILEENENKEKEKTSWANILTGQTKQTKAHFDVLNVISNDTKDRNKRESNVVIMGISNSTKTNSTEIKLDDEQKAKNILNEIRVDGIVIKSVFRMKTKKENEPMVISFMNVTERNRVLKAASCLKEQNKNQPDKTKCIYINPDLTAAERELEKQLRIECIKKNKQLPLDSDHYFWIRNASIKKIMKKI